MATIMKASTIKLRRNAKNQFMEVAGQMIKEGADENQILVAFDSYAKLKARQFYKQRFKPASLKESIEGISWGSAADSKAEIIFIEILNENNIDFKFQYKIGPYKADFLLGDSIVCEIDGPHHTQKEQKAHDKKRDNYMRKLGYKVLRVPLIVLTLDQGAVIEEIKELLGGIGK